MTEKPLRRKEQLTARGAAVVGHRELRRRNPDPQIGLTQMHEGLEDSVGSQRAQSGARGPHIALKHAVAPSAVRHQLAGVCVAAIPLKARLVKLDTCGKRRPADKCRRDDVVQVGLLVRIRKVRRRRPTRMRQRTHRRGLVRETGDAPIQLLQHPRRRVAVVGVLDIEYARVGKRAI